MTKPPLIVLTGPTAVGKTKLSVELARVVNGEIISADSMQVYKYMDIGTAKIMPEETAGIKHYLVDELEPDEPFNVVVFQSMAKKALRKIYEQGRIPIVVGGTGFYIQALLYDIDFTENDEDQEYRKSLEELAKRKGNETLHQMLKEADAPSAEKIHPNNVKKVIRALEFFEKTGQRISDHNEEQMNKVSPYNFAYFVLNNDRDILYQRINDRIDRMLEDGLLEEVKCLMDRGYSKELISMQGLGYKEIMDYYNGKSSLDEAVYILKRDTRHFAKRQITWFKREKDVIWLDKSSRRSDQEILNEMLKILRNKDII